MAVFMADSAGIKALLSIVSYFFVNFASIPCSLLSYLLKNYGKKKEMKSIVAKEYDLEKMTTWNMNSLLMM